MTTMVAKGYFSFIPPTSFTNRTLGSSDTYRVVERNTLEAYSQNSFNIYIDAIESAVEGCSKDNWDDRGATRIPDGAISNSAAFLTRLDDLGIFSPTIDPDPEGFISIEWYVDPDNVLTIGIDDAKLASWSFLMGGLGNYGEVDIDERFQGPIVEALREIQRIHESRDF